MSEQILDLHDDLHYLIMMTRLTAWFGIPTGVGTHASDWWTRDSYENGNLRLAICRENGRICVVADWYQMSERDRYTLIGYCADYKYELKLGDLSGGFDFRDFDTTTTLTNSLKRHEF